MFWCETQSIDFPTQTILHILISAAMASHTASERSSKTDTISVPFSALPLDPSGPPGNAWGRFGPDDQLGTLNLLTPATVAAAASEIESGIRISLDWPLDKQLFPLNNRPALVHQIKRRGPEGRVVNDDLLHFNTQSSSQWDGLRHYGVSISHVCGFETMLNSRQAI